MKKTKLEWKKFEPLFGTWAPKFKPFFDKGGFDHIYDFLKGQSRKGIRIAPESINTYRAFSATDFNELKCVIVCQDPYAKFINNAPIASGVAMDCSITARIQPTLKSFYEGIEKELFNGLELNYQNDNYDLSYLSAQGVLLLNTALTVQKDKPGSHISVWEEFTLFLLKEVIAPTGVPILFLGRDAGSYELVCAHSNPTFVASHPASASYTKSIWDPKGAFTWLNEQIWDSNQETILWLPIDVPF